MCTSLATKSAVADADTWFGIPCRGLRAFTGGDLWQYLNARGAVDEESCRYFMVQLAEGLKVLRQNNIVHVSAILRQNDIVDVNA